MRSQPPCPECSDSTACFSPSDPPLSSDSALSLTTRLLTGHNSQSAEFTFVERPLTDRGTLNLLQIKNPHCSTALQCH
ncbi:hypothetical protein MHYP_G00021590 [Metynnis hypsauchen]